MLVTIRLYGHLGKQFGKEFQFDIDTVAESIRALDANLPGFKAYLIEHSEPGYRVIVDNHPVMDVEELGLCTHEAGIIKIVPVVRGAGGGKTIGKIILGVALIAVAFIPGVGVAIADGLASMGMTGIGAGAVSFSLGMMGLSMLMGGITRAIALKSA